MEDMPELCKAADVMLVTLKDKNDSFFACSSGY